MVLAYICLTGCKELGELTSPIRFDFTSHGFQDQADTLPSPCHNMAAESIEIRSHRCLSANIVFGTMASSVLQCRLSAHDTAQPYLNPTSYS